MSFKNLFTKKEKTPEVKAKKQNKRRSLQGTWKNIVRALCIMLAAFQLYAAGSGKVDDTIIMSVHLAFIMLIIYLLYPATQNSSTEKPSILDVVFGVMSFGVAMYVSVFSEKINLQMGIPTTVDLVLGVIAILLILEATRRSIGKELAIVAVVFFAYALLGNKIPGTFKHAGYNVKQITKILYLTDEGIFGTALNTSATYVVLFIFFGAIMSQIGMSKLLSDFSLAVAGQSMGGPAKVAGLASGLMGTVSGSTSANVATTGLMTIPLMKSVGYSDEYSGAVECVASAGGQIMPPIMGAAAFLMAQFIGVNYSVIVIAAIIPAFLYYMSLWISVDLRARNRGLKTLSKDEIPDLKDTLINYGHMGIPLIALIYFLAIKKFNPIYAGWLGILIAVIVSFFRKNSRMNLTEFLDALENGVKSTLSVACACACAGIIIGVISLTGFGLVFSMNIFSLSSGNLLLALLLAMVASVVLGMGLPTTACYIVTSLTLAPALVQMGVSRLAAHFFVFYFSIMSTITPPVALSAFVAAGLSGGDPFKTGLTAFRLAITGFIIPFMLVYKPQLLVEGYPLSLTLYSLMTAIIGVAMLAIANEGYLFGKLGNLHRLALLAATIGLLLLDWKGDLIAIPLVIVIIIAQKRKSRRLEEAIE